MRCYAVPPSGTEEEKHADCFAFLYRRKHSNYTGLLLQIIPTDKVASTTTNSAMKRTEKKRSFFKLLFAPRLWVTDKA